MATKELVLPSWAKLGEKKENVALVIEADTDGFMKEWMSLLGVKPDEVDQYWLEVAHQCAKMDLQSALVGTDYCLNGNAQPVEFHFSNAPQWALKKFDEGKGIAAATQGREARAHFKRVRGSIPYSG